MVILTQQDYQLIIDYYYVCIVLYALYADTVRYVLYIDNKVLLLFILVFYFCTKQMKTQ